MAARRSAPASARLPARVRGRRLRTSSTRRRGTHSIAGRKAVETPAWACRRNTSPTPCSPTRPRSISYGAWQNEPTYGYVWYPRVRPGWRPYYYGRWTTLRPWGWTWIGSDPWAWPTHHYGRWGFSAGSWFWIPGPHVGTRVGLVGIRPGLCELVPARLEQPRRVRLLDVNVHRGHRYDPLARLDRRAASRVRTRVRQRQRRQRDPHRRAEPATRSSCAMPRRISRVRGSSIDRADSLGRRTRRDERKQCGHRAVRSARRSRGARRPRPMRDPGAAFRSRRSPSAPLSGAGYPAASRDAPLRLSSLPSPTRQGVSRSRDASVPRARTAPRNTAPDARAGVHGPRRPARRLALGACQRAVSPDAACRRTTGRARAATARHAAAGRTSTAPSHGASSPADPNDDGLRRLRPSGPRPSEAYRAPAPSGAGRAAPGRCRARHPTTAALRPAMPPGARPRCA